MPSTYNSHQRTKMAQFQSVTSSSERTAVKFLKSNDWNVQSAANADHMDNAPQPPHDRTEHRRVDNDEESLNARSLAGPDRIFSFPDQPIQTFLEKGSALNNLENEQSLSYPTPSSIASELPPLERAPTPMPNESQDGVANSFPGLGLGQTASASPKMAGFPTYVRRDAKAVWAQTLQYTYALDETTSKLLARCSYRGPHGYCIGPLLPITDPLLYRGPHEEPLPPGWKSFRRATSLSSISGAGLDRADHSPGFSKEYNTAKTPLPIRIKPSSKIHISIIQDRGVCKDFVPVPQHNASVDPCVQPGSKGHDLQDLVLGMVLNGPYLTSAFRVSGVDDEAFFCMKILMGDVNMTMDAIEDRLHYEASIVRSFFPPHTKASEIEASLIREGAALGRAVMAHRQKRTSLQRSFCLSGPVSEFKRTDIALDIGINRFIGNDLNRNSSRANIFINKLCYKLGFKSESAFAKRIIKERTMRDKVIQYEVANHIISQTRCDNSVIPTPPAKHKNPRKSSTIIKTKARVKRAVRLRHPRKASMKAEERETKLPQVYSEHEAGPFEPRMSPRVAEKRPHQVVEKQSPLKRMAESSLRGRCQKSPRSGLSLHSSPGIILPGVSYEMNLKTDDLRSASPYVAKSLNCTPSSSQADVSSSPGTSHRINKVLSLGSGTYESDHEEAEKCVETHGYSLYEFMEHRRAVRREKIANRRVSLDRFFQGATSSSTPSSSVSVTSLNKLFDKYRDSPKDDPDTIGVEGAMKYLQDLDVKLDEVAVLAVGEALQAPTMGEFSRTGFVTGWKTHGADTLSKQQAVVRELRTLITIDLSLFKRIYRYTFTLARLPGQKAVALEAAVEYWRLLFSPPQGLAWATDTTPWLDWWIEFVESRWKKSVNRDMWNMTHEFCRKSLEDESLEWWDEQGAWPGVVDEFVEWVKQRRDTDGVEKMEVE